MKNAIVKQSYTCAAADLVGYLSNATGATWTLTATTAADDLAHPVAIRNDSVTDHSAKTAILTGTDANGNVLTETLNLPGTSATVTSTKMFLTLTSVVPSATIGADTMDIGWSAVAQSPWVKLNYQTSPFSAGVAVTKGGTINYDVEATLDPTLDGAAMAIKHSGITGSTANDADSYLFPVHGIRVNVNSHTSGTFVLYIIQGGN